MTENAESQLQEVKPENLYRVQQIGDPAVQMFERWIPITPDGNNDNHRRTRYFSSVIVNHAGQSHVQRFEIFEMSLSKAIKNYRTYAVKAGNELLRELVAQETAARVSLMPAANAD